MGEDVQLVERELIAQRRLGIIRDEPEYYEIGARGSNVDPISEQLSAKLSKYELHTRSYCAGRSLTCTG